MYWEKFKIFLLHSKRYHTRVNARHIFNWRLNIQPAFLVSNWIFCLWLTSFLNIEFSIVGLTVGNGIAFLVSCGPFQRKRFRGKVKAGTYDSDWLHCLQINLCLRLNYLVRIDFHMGMLRVNEYPFVWYTVSSTKWKSIWDRNFNWRHNGQLLFFVSYWILVR